MRTSVAFALVILSTACDYRTTYGDCITCSSGSCPSGYSCESDGVCRASGLASNCNILGDAAIETPVDARHADSAVDAPQAAIAIDVPASNALMTNTSTMMWQHTVGTNLNRLLVVGVSIEKSGAAVVFPGGITFDGTPMQRAAYSVGGSNARAELWYLIAPQSGTHSIVVTFSPAVGSDGAVAGAVSLSGVDQTTPMPTTMTGGGTSTNPSTAISTANDNAWIIDVVMFDSSQKTLTANAGQTQRWNQETNPGANGILGAGSTLQTTSHRQYTMSWTPSSTDNWAQVVAEIKP